MVKNQNSIEVFTKLHQLKNATVIQNQSETDYKI